MLGLKSLNLSHLWQWIPNSDKRFFQAFSKFWPHSWLKIQRECQYIYLFILIFLYKFELFPFWILKWNSKFWIRTRKINKTVKKKYIDEIKVKTLISQLNVSHVALIFFHNMLRFSLLQSKRWIWVFGWILTLPTFSVRGDVLMVLHLVNPAGMLYNPNQY